MPLGLLVKHFKFIPTFTASYLRFLIIIVVFTHLSVFYMEGNSQFTDDPKENFFLFAQFLNI